VPPGKSRDGALLLALPHSASLHLPACGQAQSHGGTCDACGVDFLKYGLVHLGRMQVERLASARASSTATSCSGSSRSCP